MKINLFLCIIFLAGCTAEKNGESSTKKTSGQNNIAVDNVQNHANVHCEKDICLQLRNYNKEKKSFDIYLLNSVPVAGFQCDFPGINIIGSDGGLLKENEYQTSNSASRILSFSMQAKLIPVGEGILTTILFSESIDEICMTEIIFAGIGGNQLSSNSPECLKLN